MAGTFLAVYEENADAVHGYLAYRCSGLQEAEDLTQLTFERALRAWPRYDPARASARTWLLAIARNALIDERRRRRPELSIDAPGEDGEASLATGSLTTAGPEQRLGGVSGELDDALARVQPREREVLALRYGADLNAAEIAEMLGLSVANVHQLNSRGLRKLRSELEARSRAGGRSGGEGSGAG